MGSIEIHRSRSEAHNQTVGNGGCACSAPTQPSADHDSRAAAARPQATRTDSKS